MDIKDLNKAQLILLAVLLSFVTSIVTGITTVTLMQQAPSSFTVPVNRIIRQTVEKIQQVEGKTQTVVVKEEDLVVDAIAKNATAVFAVSKEVLDERGNIVEIGAGKGFAISKDGVVVVDGNLAFISGIYYLKNDSGKFKADFMFLDRSGISFLKMGDPVDGKNKAVFTVPIFGDLDKMKIGQKVLVLGSAISSSIFEGNGSININSTKSNAGGLVLNLDGEALGIAIFNDNASFVPIKTIMNAFNLYSSKQ